MVHGGKKKDRKCIGKKSASKRGKAKTKGKTEMLDRFYKGV